MRLFEKYSLCLDIFMEQSFLKLTKNFDKIDLDKQNEQSRHQINRICKICKISC